LPSQLMSVDFITPSFMFKLYLALFSLIQWQTFSPVVNTWYSTECQHAVSYTVDHVSDELSAAILPTISTKRQHGAVPSGARVLRVPIAQRDPIPLHYLRHHPGPTQNTLFFEPHALSQRNRRLVRWVCRPLYTPKAEPATPRWRTGQLEAVVQDEPDGVGGDVSASEFGEHDDPSGLYAQVRGRRSEQADHPRECVVAAGACLVDYGEEDVGWAAAYEGFDLQQDLVEACDIDRVITVDIGMGFDLVCVRSCVEGRDERRQFDSVGLERRLMEGHHPVDIVWVGAIPRLDSRAVRVILLV
jgi:hypothetical protein